MNKRVLVVDNSPVVLQFMVDILSRKGYEVATAGDGLSALDILKKFVPDVIFVDFIMPNIDGTKLCRLLRKMPELKDSYIVIFSAIESDEKIDLARIGADAYLPKGDFRETAQQVFSILDQSDQKSVGELPESLPDSDRFIPREISRELLSTKRHLEMILGSMSEGILQINAQNRVVYSNQTAASLIELPEEKLLGMPVVSLFRKADYRKVEKMLETGHTLDDKISDDVILNRSGRPVILDFVPFKMSGCEAILILNDASERKHAQAAIREREQTYHSLFENAPVSLWEEDCSAVRAFLDDLQSNGIRDFRTYFEEHPEALAKCIKLIKIIDVNKNTISLFEAKDRKHMLGSFGRILIGGSYDQFLKEAVIALAQGKTSFEGVTERQTLQGNKKHFLIRWTIMPGHEQRLSRILISYLDLTDRMQAEENMRKAKEEAEAARQALKRINEQLAEANKELQRQTLIDSLTGIANRRYFDQVLAEEWRRALRNQEPLTFLLGDIDHFKRFNDFYGHHQGDECLMRIAKTLNQLARRPGDLASRYGGEEFGIILSHTSAKDAYHMAEKARKAILGLRIEHRASDVCGYVTISIGVASMIPNKHASPEVLVQAADKLLYEAKRDGRNCVRVAKQRDFLSTSLSQTAESTVHFSRSTFSKSE